MSLYAYWQTAVDTIQHSPFFRGALNAGTVLILLFFFIVMLLGITFLLRLYFKKHEGINRAHRILVYSLTMMGVLILLFAAVLGAMLPLIPGILFLLLALILIHRYHKSRWLNSKISWIRIRLRMKEGKEKLKRKVKRSKIGKALREKERPVGRGGKDGARTHER